MKAEATRILMIEDNPADVRLIQEMLSEIKTQTFQLETAETLKAGIKRLSEGGIDLILLDLRLPDAEGEEVFNQVYHRAPDLPIVALTGTFDEEKMGLKLMQRGAADYLLKGACDASVLKRTIDYVIQRNNILLQLKKYAQKTKSAKAQTKEDKKTVKRVCLFIDDKEQKELLSGWLKTAGYKATSIDEPGQILDILAKENPDVFLMDLDTSYQKDLLKLYTGLRKDPHFSSLIFLAIAYAENRAGIKSILEAGVDSIAIKPLEVENFIGLINSVYGLKLQKKKVIDLGVIETLIDTVSKSSRDDFFYFSGLVINRLFMDRLKGIVGEPIVITISKRLETLVGAYYSFMKNVKFSEGQIVFDDVEKASHSVSVIRLACGLKDYVYMFLSLLQTLTSDILLEWGD